MTFTDYLRTIKKDGILCIKIMKSALFYNIRRVFIYYWIRFCLKMANREMVRNKLAGAGTSLWYKRYQAAFHKRH